MSVHPVTVGPTLTVTYDRLRVTDPARWAAAALTWRRWAALAGVLCAEFGPLIEGLRTAWSGAAAEAAVLRLATLRRRLVVFRLLCWRADQILSEFAAALTRARALLDRARAAAAAAASSGGLGQGGTGPGAGGTSAGLADAGSGSTGAGTAGAGSGSAGAGSGSAGAGSATAGSGRAGAGSATAGSGRAGAGGGRGGAGGVDLVPGVPGPGAAELGNALRLAASADASAAARLAELTAIPVAPASDDRPSCTATPAQVRLWWAALSPGERMWLLGTEPTAFGGLNGIPAADRDLANRLLLADRRDELLRHGGTAGTVQGLDRLADRLADDRGPRAYLMGLDVSGDGRAVVAFGDPDRAANVLTHVPGMTSDLASLNGELTRAERVAGRATDLGPAEATSAVLWLDYDAPDFLPEASSARQARDGAGALRLFQDGLRATHEGAAARQTVLGHSYGSLVVGEAATGGLDADRVVFVGSPGVGVESAAQLHLPADRVFASTSISDPIQYLAVSPAGAARELVPGLGLAPTEHLWFGHDPSDPAFGAQVFHTQADGGHLGYWDPGKPALDALATITLGGHPK